ncbi:tRNA (adenosine(37)-N6)-threonylcarbamoyltransferase complex dimerization subunit type 1 TsaB [Cycloclasticus pugetii]|uniref:tRNA (adenosine(37)-N6)-threonylcarbamoyltransferase complex dimerization subunit type 1 TsaB n=1 Tax=Cycloclasticus pugetii TaxID=34068 RepID=UPI000911DB2D|nr:tRNA (adenosine(37)-N6)-threonylcarbamoyltransferase complex dimerization subunit type 1 TsaB [Cycloclasticus pugetii]SHJ01970.1 tRNA threonylcarbamoyladenosine biosynthesis protein TsaB [Cycloclasticus pugetii]
MKILAIETATEGCSAALLINGEVIDRFQVAPREHGNLILPMVDELLNEAGMTLQQLDALAFGRGPGSFTGVRMATGVIQGLAFAAELPIAPVSTLTALAYQAGPPVEGQTVYAALDARMGEVYWCEYERIDGQLKAVSNESVIAPAALSVTHGKQAIGIGHGWGTYENELAQLVNASELLLLPNALPRAREVAQLAVGMVRDGQTVSADNALPVYLRDNVAKKKAQQQS